MNRLAPKLASLLALTLLLSAASRATEQVQLDYMLNCQGCHLPGGEGMPSRGVPRATDNLAKFLHVAGGREFLVQVPGAAMSDLSDERLAAVLNWMLRNFSPAEIPEGFAPYTGQEVADLRASPLINVSATRATLMQRIDLLDRPEGHR